MSGVPPAGGEPRELPPTLAPAGESVAGAPAGDLVGTTLAGRYRIVRKLGEGAMGAVYLGEHLKIGRQDAIKVLRDALATDREAIARFVRGTRNVSMIRHRNICTIYDYSDTADGLQFVAMEYVPGETLKDLLEREGALPLPEAVHIARQVADALQAAHEAGIVHRDLKPANIMVVPGRHGEREIKVVDFDIAKGPSDGEGQEVTRHGFVVGTPEYMSPEQLIGDRLDGRSDVYSLALVLFRMLTGTLPFPADDTQELMIKRLTERPLLLAEARPGAAFPEALERAIHRALSRRPADRQASAEEFGEEITAAVAGAPARPASPSASAVIGAATRPPAAATPAGEPLPETRLYAPHPAPTTTSAPPQGAPSAGSRSRVGVGVAAGVGGLLVVGAAAAMLLRGGEEAPPPRPLERSAPSEALSSPASAPSAAEPAADEPTAAQEGGPAPRGGAPRASDAAASAAPEPSRPAPAGTARGSAPFTVATADATLWRLFDRVGPPYPQRAALAAVRDSALAIWNWEGAPTNQRAFAAYIAGSTLIPLGDTAQAVQWLERAVELRPDGPGYAALLDSYRKRLR